MDLDQLFNEAIATSKAATAATARYVDALGARARFATFDEYREHRAAMRESMRIARGVASAALEAYCSATSVANAIALDAYLAERT